MSAQRTVILGRLGADPLINFTNEGNSVTNFRVATSEVYKDKLGERKETVEWHTLVAFGQRADFVVAHFRKGDMGYFEGKLRYRKWTDKHGVERISAEIHLDQVAFAGGNRRDAPAGDHELPQE